jgi:hypothetical protein
MVETEGIIWKDPNSNELERGIILLNNDILTVNDRDSQTILSCPINDPRLTYTTYIHLPEDRLIIDFTYEDQNKGVDFTIRPEGKMKEFLKIIYKLEDQSFPMNISQNVKLASHPKFMRILSFINIILVFYLGYITEEHPDVYKIIEIHLGSGSFTQYQVYELLMIAAIITVVFTRILYTNIHRQIRYFQIVGPIKSYSGYSFERGSKNFDKIWKGLLIFVIIDIVVLLLCYSILILYSQLLIGIVLFLFGSILPAKLLYTPIKFLLTKKDLQYYVGDYF